MKYVHLIFHALNRKIYSLDFSESNQVVDVIENYEDLCIIESNLDLSEDPLPIYSVEVG